MAPFPSGSLLGLRSLASPLLSWQQFNMLHSCYIRTAWNLLVHWAYPWWWFRPQAASSWSRVSLCDLEQIGPVGFPLKLISLHIDRKNMIYRLDNIFSRRYPPGLSTRHVFRLEGSSTQTRYWRLREFSSFAIPIWQLNCRSNRVDWCSRPWCAISRFHGAWDRWWTNTFISPTTDLGSGSKEDVEIDHLVYTAMRKLLICGSSLRFSSYAVDLAFGLPVHC